MQIIIISILACREMYRRMMFPNYATMEIRDVR
jgi:hypothetical protein